MNSDLLFLEMFGSDNNIEIREVPRVPELDFDGIEGATNLFSRQEADKAIQKVVFSDLLRGVVGDDPVPEQQESIEHELLGTMKVSGPPSRHRRAIEGMVTKAFPVARTTEIRDARNALIDSMEYLFITELKQH